MNTFRHLTKGKCCSKLVHGAQFYFFENLILKSGTTVMSLAFAFLLKQFFKGTP